MRSGSQALPRDGRSADAGEPRFAAQQQRRGPGPGSACRSLRPADGPSADAVDGGIPDAYAPDLSVGQASEQAIRGSEDVRSNLILSCLDVDGNDLPFVAWFELRS